MQGTSLNDAFQTFYNPSQAYFGTQTLPALSLSPPVPPLPPQPPPVPSALPSPPIIVRSRPPPPARKRHKTKHQHRTSRRWYGTKRFKKRYYCTDVDDSDDSSEDDSSDDFSDESENARIASVKNDWRSGIEARLGGMAFPPFTPSQNLDLDVFRVPKVVIWVCVGIAILVAVVSLLVLVAKVQTSTSQCAATQAELLLAVRQLIKPN